MAMSVFGGVDQWPNQWIQPYRKAKSDNIVDQLKRREEGGVNTMTSIYRLVGKHGWELGKYTFQGYDWLRVKSLYNQLQTVLPFWTEHLGWFIKVCIKNERRYRSFQFTSLGNLLMDLEAKHNAFDFTTTFKVHSGDPKGKLSINITTNVHQPEYSMDLEVDGLKLKFCGEVLGVREQPDRVCHYNIPSKTANDLDDTSIQWVGAGTPF